jgi:hypothetical protein
MRKLTALIIPAAIAALALPSAASAADYGPNTCLNGFVWREAFSGDAVCVPPATRTRAAQDNAAAASRRDPNAGYGPQGCKPGFVWREARASDLVCVTPAVRTQAKADNAAAAQRRNSVRLTLDRWYSKGLWRHRVNVTNVNVGQAYVGFFKSNGDPITGWYVKTSPAGVGGRLSYGTDRLVCNGGKSAYFRVKDMSSGRWSERVHVTTGCVPI